MISNSKKHTWESTNVQMQKLIKLVGKCLLTLKFCITSSRPNLQNW